MATQANVRLRGIVPESRSILNNGQAIRAFALLNLFQEEPLWAIGKCLKAVRNRVVYHFI
jgi:hypothetical protein